VKPLDDAQYLAAAEGSNVMRRSILYLLAFLPPLADAEAGMTGGMAICTPWPAEPNDEAAKSLVAKSLLEMGYDRKTAEAWSEGVCPNGTPWTANPNAQFKWAYLKGVYEPLYGTDEGCNNVGEAVELQCEVVPYGLDGKLSLLGETFAWCEGVEDIAVTTITLNQSAPEQIIVMFDKEPFSEAMHLCF